MAEFQPIATMRSAFPTKFGIPRQSGLVTELKSTIVFEPPYRNPEMLRGIEGFSHLWLIWSFSQSGDHWSPTVRPPRLGGNQRMGVFATRSPFRPNNIGLSSVRLERVELHTPEGPVLHVSGADLMDGTPIYDVKPYLPYVDCKVDAAGGFAEQHKNDGLTVTFDGDLEMRVPAEQRAVLRQILAQDPRPSYQEDPERIYGMDYAGMRIRFRVADGCLRVCSVQ